MCACMPVTSATDKRRPRPNIQLQLQTFAYSLTILAVIGEGVGLYLTKIVLNSADVDKTLTVRGYTVITYYRQIGNQRNVNQMQNGLADPTFLIICVTFSFSLVRLQYMILFTIVHFRRLHVSSVISSVAASLRQPSWASHISFVD